MFSRLLLVIACSECLAASSSMPALRGATPSPVSNVSALEDELKARESTEFKVGLSRSRFAGDCENNFEKVARDVLDSVLSPALAQLNIPHGTNVARSGRDFTEVAFWDTESRRVHDAGMMLRSRHNFDSRENRHYDFTFKYRGSSRSDTEMHNMSTTLRTASGDRMCGRHDFDFELLDDDLAHWSTQRSFRSSSFDTTDHCTQQILDGIAEGRLHTAGAWAEIFPGLGFSLSDMESLAPLKTAYQKYARIGGGAVPGSTNAVPLCNGVRLDDGECDSAGLTEVVFEVQFWYAESNLNEVIGAEVTWDLDGLSTCSESNKLLAHLRSNFSEQLGVGTKTSALFGV